MPNYESLLEKVKNKVWAIKGKPHYLKKSRRHWQKSKTVYNSSIMLIPVPKRERPKYESGVNEMGLVYAEIDLLNGGDVYLYRQGLLEEGKVKQVQVNALVDTGAYMLSINETVRAQLDLPFIEKQFGTLADETLIEVDVFGPVEIRFENRR